MYKICLSGGSCGGKSTVLDRVRQEFHNFQTFIVPETASEVMRMGLNREIMSNTEIEKFMYDLQIHKENIVNSVAGHFPGSLVFYDRGLLDLLAYIDRLSFDGWLDEAGINFQEVLDRYDLIIHLVSAAVGTKNYNLDNPYRIENQAQAVLSEHATLQANQLHPNLIVIDNSTGFEEKIKRVMSVIRDFVLSKTPVPIQEQTNVNG